MFVLTDTQRLLVFLFLVTSMLSIGLRSGWADLLALLRTRAFLGRALLANFVVVPLVGFALARALPVSPETAVALIILACVPGGLSAIHFTIKVEGEEAVAETLFVALTLMAVLVSPLAVRLALQADLDLNFPHGRALAFVAISILIPLCVGIYLGGMFRGRASKAAKLLGIVSAVLFVAFTVMTKSFRTKALSSLTGPAIVAVLAFIVVSMAVGWLMGGPTHQRRQMLASVTSIRNTAVCLTLAKNTPSGDAILPPLIAFSLLMVPLNTLFTLFGTIRSRRSAARARKAQKDRES